MVCVSRALTALLILALVCASSANPRRVRDAQNSAKIRRVRESTNTASLNSCWSKILPEHSCRSKIWSTRSSPGCPSCYGAEDPARKLACCMTCDEVDRTPVLALSVFKVQTHQNETCKMKIFCPSGTRVVPAQGLGMARKFQVRAVRRPARGGA